ncbi:MAG: uncharacterized protein KVP18_001634 [Porospora cf. gigantea A]|uniref:uncharacterized protein n=1 Tax=Porospora cf. gigantea A TaxID=2853593 RepID=UPI0035599A2E|nr:MAG: hypothetical protein KVP18_001634 [Porospora cf. gigantea A]
MHRDLRDARKPPAKPPPLPPPQCPEYPLDTLADVELQEVQPFLSHETTADILLRLLQQSTPDWNDNAPYRRPELLSSTLYNLASPGWSTSVNDVRMLISSESIETAPVRAYILGEFPRLAMSPSQHELVKSYLEVCSPEAFVEVIRVHFAQISTLSKHVYACRIVQQLVSMAATEVCTRIGQHSPLARC